MRTLLEEQTSILEKMGREAQVLAPLRGATNHRSMAGLSALQNTSKHVYAGTVDPVEVKRRRAANKRARAARKRAHRALKNK